MNSKELTSIIESLLFTAKKPVTVTQVHEWLGGEEFTVTAIQEVLKAIGEFYSQNERGLRLIEVAEGYQFRTPKENGVWIQRSITSKPVRLSAAALEVLAIVAYKQPVTRMEVESVRGVDSSHLLKTLIERKLVQMEGKTDDPGRPVLYATGPDFLEFFSLKNLKDLPTLRDLEDLSGFGGKELGATSENH